MDIQIGLQNCPSDLLQKITFYLSSSDLINLFLTFNKKMIEKMSICIREFKWRSVSLPKSLISMLTFLKLRKLHLEFISDRYDWPQFISPSSIIKLSSTIQEMTIIWKHSQSCWISPGSKSLGRYPQQRCSPIRFNETFPNLTKLVLKGDSWERFKEPKGKFNAKKKFDWNLEQKTLFMSQLPLTLTHIDMDVICVDSSGLGYLTNLVSLSTKNLISPENVIVALPTSILHLKIKTHLKQNGLNKFSHLPSLVSADIDSKFQTCKMIISHLPKSIEQLKIKLNCITRDDFAYFENSNIRSLDITSTQFPLYDFTSHLPQSLTEFRTNYDAAFDWSNLPSGLKILVIGPHKPNSKIDLRIQNSTQVQNSNFQNLPKSLTWLEFHGEARPLKPQLMQLLPPSLTKLVIARLGVSIEWFKLLPPNLKSFSFQTITMHDWVNHLDDVAPRLEILQLPNPTHLFKTLYPNLSIDGTILLNVTDYMARLLPPSITVLDIDYCSGTLTHNFWLDANFSNLKVFRYRHTSVLYPIWLCNIPKTVTNLSLICNSTPSSPQLISSLPPNLTKLSIDFLKISEDCIKALPRGLTQLEIEPSPEPLKLAPSAISHLPRGLTHLKLYIFAWNAKYAQNLPPNLKLVKSSFHRTAYDTSTQLYTTEHDLEYTDHVPPTLKHITSGLYRLIFQTSSSS